MGDTKEGREEQAAHEEQRQRARDLAETLARSDELEPADLGLDESQGERPTCHRRGCDDPASFVVLERYQEETGQGPVESAAVLCEAHASEESPTNIDATSDDYLFRVDPIADPSE
jgi:hypothetical protein